MTTYSRDRVIEFRQKHPNMTLSEIGIEIGISKQRVSQILASEKLETRSLQNIPLPMPLCKRCGTPVPYRKRIYCSPQCQRPTGRTTTNCYRCNKEITLMTSVYKSRQERASRVHCSRKCRDETRRGQN